MHIISEDFLKYVWQYSLFTDTELKTTTGETVQIINPGLHNTHAGPDFTNAKVRINDTLWIGNVEIHIIASDWYKHKHNIDVNYDNIILHVVYNEDEKITNAKQQDIPCLEVKPILRPNIKETYTNLLKTKSWIPCENYFVKPPNLILTSWIDTLVISRLERKVMQVTEVLEYNNQSWDDTFYQFMAKNMGQKTNGMPFELLAKSLPQNILAKHKDSILQIEALLFGQAGFLSTQPTSTYQKELQNEYLFLKQKYNLTPIENNLWKFLRLRPPNFPTIRIAQFAQIIFHSKRLFACFLDINNANDIYKLLQYPASEFWNTHYKFDKESIKRKKQIGKTLIDTLIINTVIPCMYAYGKYTNKHTLCDKSLDWLNTIKAEKNTVINNWGKLKIEPQSAYESQALLELKHNYCDKKQCLNCRIGNFLLKR